jgi:CysZ protein
MFRLSAQTADSLASPAGVKTMLWCGALSGLVLLLWIGGFNLLLHQLTLLGGWMDTLLDILLGMGSLVMAWFLFPVILPAIGSLFLDGFLEGVSQREYGRALRSVPIREELPQTLLFLVQALAINLVLLPAYFIPLFGQGLYYGINGYLLAREFWGMIAKRLDVSVHTLPERRITLLISGILFVLCANIPFLNLLTPMIAAVYMLHLGYRVKQGSVLLDQ